MKIEKQHLKIFSKHKHIYDLFEKTGELVNFTHDVQNELADAYRHYHPHFHYNRHCPLCVADMLVTIYKFYGQHARK